jgi:hypothetical protein
MSTRPSAKHWKARRTASGVERSDAATISALGAPWRRTKWS